MGLGTPPPPAIYILCVFGVHQIGMLNLCARLSDPGGCVEFISTAPTVAVKVTFFSVIASKSSLLEGTLNVALLSLPLFTYRCSCIWIGRRGVHGLLQLIQSHHLCAGV